MRKGLAAITFGLALALGNCMLTSRADAQYQYYPSYQLNHFYYYPYHYFPHNYWPAYAPKWPEGPGMHYQKPPAYQAYPAFREPGWRHEWMSPQRYYKGFHFWLDQF